MVLSNFLKSSFLDFLLPAIALAIIFFTQALTPAQKKYEPSYLNPPRIERFTFGHQEFVADIFWLRSIQDFHYCETQDKEKICRGKRWLFHMLNLITDIAPKFRMPYAAGGLALTVLINDYEGASRIFDKGVLHFPTDWPLLSRAAYHALYEEKNKVKAADLLKKAALAGGPAWYYQLAGRLYSDENEQELAQALIYDLKQNSNIDAQIINKIEERLKERANSNR